MSVSKELAPRWPEGVARVVLEEVDSTMAEAMRRAPPDAPTWILAHRQTAARGRLGRHWAMPEGAFAATYLCRPDRPAREVALTSFQAALALFETLALYTPREKLALKWPNDVLLDGGKVAGILLESVGSGEVVAWLAVGIGINLATAPDPSSLAYGALRPVALADHLKGPIARPGRPPAPEEVLEHLAATMERIGDLWREGGFDAMRRLWLTRAARLGEPIVARTAKETVEGIFETVDADGRLVLATAEGERRIAAADVYFA